MTNNRLKQYLSEYLRFISKFITSQTAGPDILVSFVTNDSRKTVKDSIFVAIRGAKADGHKFIDKAIANGASIIVHQHDLEIPATPGIRYIRVSDSYLCYALLVEKYYGCPTDRLKLVGVTGTNGKTTSAYLIRAILTEAGFNVGLISTVNYLYGDKNIPADRTTPEASELYALFADMAGSGCTHVVMEVSSHSLDQHRLGHVRFDAVLFTNLTGDHLDYHHTMENYYQAKKRLFTEYSDSHSSRIINCDDAYGNRLYSELAGNCNVAGVSSGGQYKYQFEADAGSAESCISGIKVNCVMYGLKSNLLGAHNAYNISGAIAVCNELGISMEVIAQVISAGVSVPGRLEKVASEDGAMYFVDYAHTDDALERVLETLKKIRHKQLFAVFGCGGDRDRTKRPRMARVVSRLADVVIITSDNPRTENPEAIIRDIEQGVIPGKKYEAIPDRRQAINLAVSRAGKGDIVLIAGKGHEDYQEINGVKHPFDDRVVVQEALGEKNNNLSQRRKGTKI